MSDHKRDTTSPLWREVEEVLPGTGDPAPPLQGAERHSFSRRSFMGIMSASAALAGTTTVAGCVRKPIERIVPFVRRPEDRIPGKAVFYASTFQVGATVQGIVVESQDGRPIKIEGNPGHPGSLGAASAWAQASVLDLYDPDRSRAPRKGNGRVRWAEALAAVDEMLAAARSDDGASLALVLDAVMSPTQRALLAQVKEALPSVHLVQADTLWPTHTFAGAALVAGPGAVATPSLEGAEIIVALDADPLGLGVDSVRHSRAFGAGRRVLEPGASMNRLYAVGAALTVTAGAADHRLRVASPRIGDVAKALVVALADAGLPGAEGLKPALGGVALEGPEAAFVSALAKDLAAHKGKAVVLVGERQPAWVHALGHLANSLLGADGALVTWRMEGDLPAFESVAELAAGLAAGTIQHVLCVGTNPAYDGPADADLPAALGRAKTLIHAGLYRDETARLAHWHLPLAHYLESWSDLRGLDGTASIVQPLLAPLHGGIEAVTLLGRLTGQEASAHSLVRAHWGQVSGGALDERAWRRWLHRGTVDDPAAPTSAQPAYEGLAAALGKPAVGGVTVEFAIDASVADGRYANNGWLQELPDPMTKLTWDNAALVAPATAAALGVVNGDLVTLSVDGRSLTLPAWLTPGLAEDTWLLPLGYGREELGSVAEGAGFDAYRVRTAAGPWWVAGSVARAGGSYSLATTQAHGSLDPGFGYGDRTVYRQATRDEYAAKPDFVDEVEVMPADKVKSHLFDPPVLTAAQQWGMVIDLGACVGCNACTVACNAENNVPVVGKQRVLEGREMHWIRIDRYYAGDPAEPQAVMQPVACQQCETAPCETVCPVAATAHSPEGLNDMAYNRCIGTRYCANNCPFKVRRFNFFNFNEELTPLEKMAKNPDVTVRFRGVMEKCSYCVQRITEARIATKVQGEDKIPDGMITPACQQTCPTDAIVFGDLADPKTKVSVARAQQRNFGLLAELNLHARTTYLARIRNPNPELG